MNTADITIVMAITAPVISFIALIVAGNGAICSSEILTWTASTTTMALSTTIPIESTRAKRVSKLIEKPIIDIKVKEPISATGTARTGINVERQSWRNIKTTKATRIKASISVFKTSSIEASRKRDTSYAILNSIPGGKELFLSSAIFSLTLAITSDAFEPGRCFSMMDADGFPSVLETIP
ncbi:hypothetical protein D3C86_1075900 [compost metagenome]